ncbi:hypothetical protein JCGZ_16500 [Jatropha curcas]|uniref:Uncharacterized protein n=1 Tax=Jatropha curcas TaxID=180498 RepID=A0A067JYR8_JATCU|nr:hypothetical protein JCGZ_16500 [Jatropha curcas]
MAKQLASLYSWIEVAPALIIYPQKPSNSPSLETILEEMYFQTQPYSSAETTIPISPKLALSVEVLTREGLKFVEMAKQIKDLSSWIEVAPALFISLHKISNSPSLETITEETEDRKDDSKS